VAARATAVERAGSARGLDPPADGVEIDAERRECRGVDTRKGRLARPAADEPLDLARIRGAARPCRAPTSTKPIGQLTLTKSGVTAA
jgi:hypothetical protein